MMLLAALLLLLQSPEPLNGMAAFSYRVESAAQVRGVELSDPGCALVDCALLGAEAWVYVGDRWVGPLTSVDCGATHDREFLEANDRVIDLPWSLWRELGLPLTPVPALVTFSPPPDTEWY